MAEQLGSLQAIIDGEVVAFDEEGRPDFQRLQQRMHLGLRRRRPAQGGREPGHLRRLRPPLPRGPRALRPPLRRPAPAPRGARARRRRAGRRPPIARATARRSSGSPASRGSRGSWPSASTAPTAGQALAHLAQGQERPQPGPRDRRLAAGRGQAHEHARRARGRLLRRGRRRTQLRYAGRVGTGFTEETLRQLSALLTQARAPRGLARSGPPAAEADRSSPSPSSWPRSSSASGPSAAHPARPLLQGPSRRPRPARGSADPRGRARLRQNRRA